MTISEQLAGYAQGVEQGRKVERERYADLIDLARDIAGLDQRHVVGCGILLNAVRQWRGQAQTILDQLDESYGEDYANRKIDYEDDYADRAQWKAHR